MLVTVNNAGSNGVNFSVWSGSFSPTGTMNVARYSPTATLLHKKPVWCSISGMETGDSALPAPISTIRQTGTGYAYRSLTTPRCDYTATLLSNGTC